MACVISTFSHADLVALLPRLRSYARALAHDRDRADDLVQGTVLQALSHQASFMPGTSLSGWMFRILRNLFIDGKRRYRPTQEIDNDIEQSHSVPATQERDLIKGEFLKAFDKLNPVQREALVLAVVEGMEYHEIATSPALHWVRSRAASPERGTSWRG
jgi:RNA polymerase sigma-70 factor (ECF subfamily)